jgi:hypothetical protein
MFQFGVGGLFGNPNGGNLATPSWPQRFGTIQNVDLDISQKLQSLYGQNKFPDDVAPSDMKITGKGGFAQIEINIYNALFYAETTTSGISVVSADESHVVPGSTGVESVAIHSGAAGTLYSAGDICPITGGGGTNGSVVVLATTTGGVPSVIGVSAPGSGYSTTSDLATTGGTGSGLKVDITVSGTYQVTVNNSATAAVDLGARYASTGQPLVRSASSTPAQGFYYVPSTFAGVYTFNSADATSTMLISYAYTNASGTTLTVQNHIQGYGPTFELWLLEPYQGTNGIHLYTCRASKMSNPLKRDNYVISDFEFEAYANAAGKVVDFFQISA